MPDAAIDLDAYCARIGYGGPRTPTLAVLQDLHHRHFRTIPFENLDVVLKRAIRLDPASLQRKLVADRRGGYCFESNGLLMHALRAFGFRVTALAARVLFERAPDPLPPRSHMVLKVDLAEGIYLVDAAFGGQTPSRPLRFELDAEQLTALEPCRLVRAEDGELDLQSRYGDRWGTLYRFAAAPQLPVDFEHANWHVSTHPDSYFVNNVIAATPGEGCRYSLFNGEFRTRNLEGKVDARPIVGSHQLAGILKDRFGLTLAAGDLQGVMALIFKILSVRPSA